MNNKFYRFSTKSMRVGVFVFDHENKWSHTDWTIQFPDGTTKHVVQKEKVVNVIQLCDKICSRIWQYVPNENISIEEIL